MKNQVLLKDVEKLVKKLVGSRCPDYCKGCFVCESWNDFDRMKKKGKKEKISAFGLK